MIDKKFKDFLGDLEGNLFTVYGEAGSGKSCFCLMSLINELKDNNRVMFFDTSNSFNLERFKQVAGKDYERYLDNLILFKIKSFKDQQLKINNIKDLIDKFKAKLIIVDPISFYYRSLRTRELELANNMLFSQMRKLKDVSKDIKIIVTSEVYTQLETNRTKYLGGRTISRFSDAVIELRKGPRRIILRKPEINEFKFKIVEQGFEIL